MHYFSQSSIFCVHPSAAAGLRQDFVNDKNGEILLCVTLPVRSFAERPRGWVLYSRSAAHRTSSPRFALSVSDENFTSLTQKMRPSSWLMAVKTWGICTRRAGKLYKARSWLYRSQILQVNMRLKALAEI